MPGEAETALILGGTKEAAALAAELVAAHPDWRVITSLAGRTKEPKPVAGEVRIGGFGGAQGLAAICAGNNHPPHRRHPPFRQPKSPPTPNAPPKWLKSPRHPHPLAMDKAAARPVARSTFAGSGPRRNPPRRAGAAGARLAADRCFRQPRQRVFHRADGGPARTRRCRCRTMSW